MLSSLGPSRSLKVYVAAAFARGGEMRRVARDLEREGHRVTSTWINESTELVAGECATAEAAMRAAVRNLEQLRESDLCIMFSTPAGSEDLGRGGRHVELGAAFAWNIPVMLVGPDEHLFHVLVAGRYQTWCECRDDLTYAAIPRLAA